MRLGITSIGLVLLVAGGVSAQEHKSAGFPEGYRVRADNPADKTSEVEFVAMAPGWHITTGPRVILYNPANTARGEYRVESESFLFDPGARNEAYGILIGGRDLETDRQQYTYFVIRRSGEFLVKRRIGAETPTVIDWQSHPAILKWQDRGESVTAKNVLAIEAGQGTVRFLVNGQEVATLPRTRIDTDGIVGLRVNHGLNIHVSSLVITQK